MDEELDDREQVVTGECARLLTELAALRGFEMPEADEDPHEVRRLLMEELRPRLDRAEQIMAELARYRRQAKRTAARLAAVTDDAYDAVMDELARKAVRLEYQSVHDRIAMARVRSSPKRKAQRAAERMADLVSEAEDAARGMFFGLRDMREEMITVLRTLPWESSLERT